MLQKFEYRKLTDDKVKNQVVMDALEMYFGALENNNQATEDKWVTKEFLEQRLEQFKQECKEEIWRELIHILAGRTTIFGCFFQWRTSGKRTHSG